VYVLSRQNAGTVRVELNDRDAQGHSLYQIHLASGERPLVELNTRDFAGYLTDDDYRVRLAMRDREDGGQDVLRPDGHGGWQVSEHIPFEDALTTWYTSVTADGLTTYL